MRLTVAAAALALSAPAAAAPLPPDHVDAAAGRPRLFVLSDIGNEPDDQMSLVRLLLYGNEIDIEGLAAVTSVFQKTATHPETMRELVAAYGQVRGNLSRHAAGWPRAETLAARIASGPAGYGMTAIDPARPSAAARALVAAADRDDPRPLWVNVWGGANTLAEALAHVRATRPRAALAAFVAKLRVHAISDQDDAGPWIRDAFPDLFWVGQPSSPDSGDFASATWTGISGDRYYMNGEGADFSTVTNEWLDAHIRKGPLGRHYPRYLFIMEGDTPAFLGLTGNGLESWRSPAWGGWGGRYVHRRPSGASRAFWTQGGDLFFRVASRDTVTGADGREHSSDQATIWRWRTAFQNDFAARVDWTVKPQSDANHPPLPVVDGRAGSGVVARAMRAGASLTLDAGASRDPDGDRLRYRWFVYGEAGGGTATSLADVRVEAEGARAVVRAVATCRPGWVPALTPPCPAEGQAHVILAVTDDGRPALTRYRRIIVTVRR
jgi:hypothetical protein